MIIAYAGRRAASMPDGSEERVLLRLRRLVTALAPSAVVGPAADGGDLLVLEAALTAPEPVIAHVILPTARDAFREASVAESWRERYDRALDHAELVESLDRPDGQAAYRAANRRVFEKARELRADDGERVVALVVASPGEGSMVEDFVALAELGGMPVLRIDPAIDPEQRPRVFVAMPFGQKHDPQRNITVDCDAVYERILVPALEHAQLRFRRADATIDAGIVLQPMIEEIAHADMVIGDLQTANFNVGWELGLRHLLRPRHTLLVGPVGMRAPFDVEALRRVTYRQDERGVDDDAVIEAWGSLRPYLEALDKPPQAGSDSPVDAVMDIQTWAEVAPRQARDKAWDDLRHKLALARELRDPEMTLEVVAQAEALDEDRRRLVAAEAGAGLVRDGSYEHGARLLAPLVEADPGFRRPDAHFYFAQALYKPNDASLEDFARAERTFKRLWLARPEFPEVWAGLGAIYKRRARRRTDAYEHRTDVAAAMDAYARDFERDLRAFYPGINVVFCGVLLEHIHDDHDAGDRARRALPVVAFAAEHTALTTPQNFWATVTVAEARLYEVLLDVGGSSEQAVAAYAAAGGLHPPAGWVDSSVDQLRGLVEQGVHEPFVREAAQALAAAAGCPARAKGL